MKYTPHSIVDRLINNLASFLVRLIPLPSVERRKDGLTMPIMKRFMPTLRLANDTDYIVAAAAMLTLKLGLAVFLLLIIDVSFRTGIVISPDEFDRNMLILPAIQRNIMLLPIILISTSYYLRIRLVIDIKRSWIPIVGHPALLSDHRPGNWFIRGFFISLISIVLTLFNHIPVFAVARYLNAEGNVAIVIVAQLVQVLAIGGIPAFLIIGIILSEKSYRFFPELQKQLTVLVEERDQLTDKYRNNNK